MSAQSIDDFAKLGDFYGGPDDESYEWKELAEYVVHLVDEASFGDVDAVAACRDVAGSKGLHVVAVKREVVDADWYAMKARGLVDRFLDEWADEGYGHPEREDLTKEQEEKLAAEIAPLLQAALPEPWSCNNVGERVLTAAEIESLCREERPEWFAEATR